MYQWHELNHNTMTQYGRQMRICFGNPRCETHHTIARGAAVPYILTKEGQPVAAAIIHPHIASVSAMGGYRSELFLDGEYMEQYIQLFTDCNVRRIIDVAPRWGGYCLVNGVWSNTRLFRKNMTVEHTLDLTNHAFLTHLPEGLTVRGNLRLARTNLSTLPANLHVDGDLDIRFTQVWTLPADIYVGGKIITSGGRNFTPTTVEP